VPPTAGPAAHGPQLVGVRVWPPTASSPSATSAGVRDRLVPVAPVSGAARPARVALVDLCDLARHGLEAVLSSYRRVAVVVGEEADACAEVDLLLHVGAGPQALGRWLAHHPDARVVRCGWGPGEVVGDDAWFDLSLPTADLVARLVALQSGAGATVAQGPGVAVPAAPPSRLVGRAGLGPREAQVLELIGQGLSNAEITALLNVTINTLKTYIRTGYRKIGVSSRTQAALWAAARTGAPGTGA